MLSPQTLAMLAEEHCNDLRRECEAAQLAAEARASLVPSWRLPRLRYAPLRVSVILPLVRIAAPAEQ